MGVKETLSAVLDVVRFHFQRCWSVDVGFAGARIHSTW